MYQIKTFSNSSPLYKEFLNFPASLYNKDPFWLPTTESYPTGLAVTYFMVFRQNEIIGRAAALINPEISYQEKKTGFLGFYECQNDSQASQMLFTSISEFFREKGYHYLIGPINGSTWHRYRVAEPEQPLPFFADQYNKDWYANQFSENDFQRIARYYSTKIEVSKPKSSRRSTWETRFQKRGITIRELNLNQFTEELIKIYQVCIESFHNNFLYSPISESDFIQLYKPVQKMVNPRFVLLAEAEAKETVAFVFALPNLFEKTKKSLVIKTVAVLPSGKFRGLGTLLVEKLHEIAFQENYEEIIHALMYQDNVSTKVLSSNAEPYRSYSLFGKELN